jgi:hypothetical protein
MTTLLLAIKRYVQRASKVVFSLLKPEFYLPVLTSGLLTGLWCYKLSRYSLPQVTLLEEEGSKSRSPALTSLNHTHVCPQKQ